MADPSDELAKVAASSTAPSSPAAPSGAAPPSVATTSAFHALVDEYVLGHPTMGHHMLTAEDVHFVAAQLLLSKSKHSSPPKTHECTLRTSACYFVLFVQEHLVYGQATILGTSVQELYEEVRTLLTGTHRITQEAFTLAVEAVDTTGTAVELLQHPGVLGALWAAGGDFEALRRDHGALQTVSEGIMYSDYDVDSSAMAEGSERVDIEMGAFAPLGARHVRIGSIGSFSPTARSRTTQRGATSNPRPQDDSEGHDADWGSSDWGFPHEAHMRQLLVSRCFADAALEAQFRNYFFHTQHIFYRNAIYMFTFSMIVFDAAAAFSLVPFLTRSLEKHFGLLTTIISLAVPTTWCIGLSVCLSTPRIFNQHTCTSAALDPPASPSSHPCCPPCRLLSILRPHLPAPSAARPPAALPLLAHRGRSM